MEYRLTADFRKCKCGHDHSFLGEDAIHGNKTEILKELGTFFQIFQHGHVGKLTLVPVKDKP